MYQQFHRGKNFLLDPAETLFNCLDKFVDIYCFSFIFLCEWMYEFIKIGNSSENLLCKYYAILLYYYTIV